MRVDSFRLERHGNKTRAVARVVWEDCDRASNDVYFEVDDEFSSDLSCNPNAFLVACAIPAMHSGEERIFIDARICPELKAGLANAMGWLTHWFGNDHKSLKVEAKTRVDLPKPRTPERAGFFFSGGIDSFSTFRYNRLNFPLEHPWSIKDGLLIYGLEIDRSEAFSLVADSLSKAARKIGIDLIPVYTNIYLEYRHEDAAAGYKFWLYKFQGAALAAVAHAFNRRLTVVSIACSDNIPHLHPYGSHPLIDPNYSSIDMRIRHDGVTLSRLAKTNLLADWGVALHHLRVCNQYKRYRPEILNCGKCEKCLRTMLALVACGSLSQTTVFPVDDVSEEQILSVLKLNAENIWYYLELLESLVKKDRHDLARAIEYKLRWYYRLNKGWLVKVKKIDHKYFLNVLSRCKRLIA